MKLCWVLVCYKVFTWVHEPLLIIINLLLFIKLFDMTEDVIILAHSQYSKTSLKHTSL